MDRKELRKRLGKDPLGRIAMWQFLCFGIILCLVWVNELLDLSNVYFGTKPSAPHLFRGALLSAFVMVTAIITMLHTYAQQKRIIAGVVTVCASCGRVRVDANAWEGFQEYVTRHSLAAFSHGLCPECSRQFLDPEEIESAQSGTTETR